MFSSTHTRFTLSGIALALCALSAGQAYAVQESARVISATPIVQQIAKPQQVCSTREIRESSVGSGSAAAGTLLGAVVGGVIGNQFGKGSGRAVMTAAGAMGGAILAHTSANNHPTVRTVEDCRTEHSYESRTTGYRVAYEFAGKQYETETREHPGAQLLIDLNPVATSAAIATQPSTHAFSSSRMATAPVISDTRVVYEERYIEPRPAVVYVHTAAPVVHYRSFHPRALYHHAPTAVVHLHRHAPSHGKLVVATPPSVAVHGGHHYGQFTPVHSHGHRPLHHYR